LFTPAQGDVFDLIVYGAAADVAEQKLSDKQVARLIFWSYTAAETPWR
jgi:hypothetical protein